MQEYLVTELAGEKIAGQRTPRVGEIIFLTEDQAAYYLREGHIVPSSGTETAAVPPPSADDTAEAPKAGRAKKNARD